jgi:hypothetical protein
MKSLPSAEFYREEAERCRALALTIKEPMARASLLMVAEMYDRLAEQVASLKETGDRPPLNSK